jgi:DNA-binding beta-propeller fold protein YncE
VSNQIRILALSVTIALGVVVLTASATAGKMAPHGGSGWAGSRFDTRIRALSLAAGDRRDGAWHRTAGANSSLHNGPFGFGSSLVGSAPVGTGPSELAVDPATQTIYVANGNNDNGPSAGGNTVSIIDARRCNAHDVSRCKGPGPTITVGNLPSGIAIDQATDTVYVANSGDNSVSVFNGATCNALHTAGCEQTPATVPVGLGPIDLFSDPANHTVYVANFDNAAGDSTTVSMIDSATCNAAQLAACPSFAPSTVDVGNPPDQVDVNQATHTAYVTTLAGWSVFDTNTCNATVQTGCGAVGSLAGDPAGPNDGQVDVANDTLYTANYDNTISAFDLRACYSGDLAGCASDTPGIVTPFPEPNFGEHDLYVAVNPTLHSVYVSYQNDAALVVIDTRPCNGSNPAGCATLNPPVVDTGADPEGVVLDTSTQTLYTANEVDDDISVFDATSCNAENTRGCRHPAPAVSVPAPGALATDDAVHTAYVTAGTDSVAMINTQGCNAYRLAGCAQTPPQFTAGQYGTDVAVDRRTHTVYIANAGAGSTGSVSVIDDRTCSAGDQAGCTQLKTMPVPGGNPVGIAVDPATGTVYVATNTASGPNLISVFNGSTCNASNAIGCSQTPAVLPVGDSGGFGMDLAINDRTNTLYVTNNPYADPTGDAVYVINTVTCDAQDTAGCEQTPATVTVGDDPAGLAVDPWTDTIYAVVHAEGDYAASVAVINGATCNSSSTTGCGQTPPTVAAGFGALSSTFDPVTRQVVTTNVQDTSVSVINGARCNAIITTGCSRTPAEDAVGNYPAAIAVDATNGTAYVANLNDVSVVRIGP